MCTTVMHILLNVFSLLFILFFSKYAQVFPFGSVPLKTYLPDGDIDLTALVLPNAEDALANSVCHVLEMEEQNNEAEFEIKDVQYIHAEVSYFTAAFLFQFSNKLV